MRERRLASSGRVQTRQGEGRIRWRRAASSSFMRASGPALLLLLLAGNAEPGERQRLKPLLANLLATSVAQPVLLEPDLLEGRVYLLQQLALRIADGKQELLRVGVCGLIGDVLDAIAAALQAVGMLLPHPPHQLTPLHPELLVQPLQ